MIRRGDSRAIWILGSTLGVGGVLMALAACASSEQHEASNNVDAQTIPPPPVPDAAADAPGAADGGCDAGDTTCTFEVLSCDEVSWCAVPSDVDAVDQLTSVWGSSKDDVWAAGSGGSITHYDGTTWKRTATNVMSTFFGIWGSGPSDIWAVSDTRVILHSDGWKNGQAIWTPSSAALGNAVTTMTFAIWGSGPNDVRIGGETFRDPSYLPGNNLLKVNGAEDDWNPLFTRTGTVFGIWGSSATDVWMIVDNSATVPHERAQTLHGAPNDPDAGGDPLVWTAVDSQSTVALRGVWGSSASDVWSVGDLGTVRHWTPADKRWQPVASPTTERLRGVWGSGPSDIWMVGDIGTILHYDGFKIESHQAQFPIGRRPNLWGVWGSGPNDVWIVGDAIALHYTGPKTSRGGQ